MTTPNLQLKQAKNLVVKIGEDNYEKHASNVNWTNGDSTIEWQGGTEDAIVNDVVETGDVCNITAAQDTDNPDSLFNFMIDHAGETATIEWRPNTLSPFKLTATITIRRPSTIGGERGTYHEVTTANPSTKPARVFDTLAAPTISSLTPDTGAAAGGTLVAIIGTGFTGVTGVTFDDEDATEYFVISPTLIHAIAPAGTAGAVDVIVTNIEGPSAAAEYTYTA